MCPDLFYLFFMLHEKARKGTYTERCYGKEITVNFDASAADLEKSVAELIKARMAPKHRCTSQFNGCCGRNACIFQFTTEFGKDWEYLSIYPKQKDQDPFQQRNCVFADCRKLLSSVVQTNVNVYTCSECNMFVCHSCKREHLLEVSSSKRARRSAPKNHY